MTALHQILLNRLNSGERLTFAEVMTQALYHQDYGYYGPGPRRIGRNGDFYTSVSIGPLYGRLLATLADQTHDELGKQSDFCVIEQAAHDGQLAEDILSACNFDYVIVEPNPKYEAVQRKKLAAFNHRVNWVSNLREAPARPSLYVCNELPDAMPVHLIRWDGSNWNELWVGADGQGALHFEEGPISTTELAAEISLLPLDLPTGFTTEVGLATQNWMRELAAATFHGRLYIADYGLDHEELYSPERHTGTIRRYRDHQTDDHILKDLGACDLTTHVNFTRLSEVGEAAGLKIQSYSHQGRYLGKLGLPWLATLEGRPPDLGTQALLRQYHSLTHPAFMGRSFRVLVMEKEKTLCP